jgi:hypothetical protein
METILDVYTRPYDALHPVVCMDELNQQLVSETRQPLPAIPGKPVHYDFEYKREGVANAFICFEPLRQWRTIDIRAQRTHREWAELMKALVAVHYPNAICITVVLDNLNTHTGASLYKVFPPAEARRILAKLDLRYTPKHGSWLNMAEIELSAFARQVLNRRIATATDLQRRATLWTAARNTQKATVYWQFTTVDARIKLKHLYPSL